MYKILHNINKWSFTITLVLYIGITTGMFAQFFLGIIQLIVAAFLTRWYYKGLSLKEQKLLQHYWIFVGIDLIAIIATAISWKLIPKTNGMDLIMAAYFFVCPMCIAAYLVYITHTIKKNFNNELQHP